MIQPLLGPSVSGRVGQLLAAAIVVAGTASAAIAQARQAAPLPRGAGSVQQGNPPLVQPPPGLVGVWIDHTGRGAVEIAPCETSLCGRIVWMDKPFDGRGKILRDKLNENTRLRQRQICGMQVIGGLRPMRDGSWDNGWIYDPEQGESFDVELRLRTPDVLQVKGYKGFKFLSETFQWHRAVPGTSLPACPPPSPA
jgi:uncharacterized protein (DUF2147 family)